MYSLPVWNLDVQNQSVGRAMLPLRLWVKSFFTSSWLPVVAVNPRHSVAHRGVTAISASVVSHGIPLMCLCRHMVFSVCVSSLLTRILVILD